MVILQHPKTIYALTNYKYLLDYIIAINLLHIWGQTNWNLFPQQMSTALHECCPSEWCLPSSALFVILSSTFSSISCPHTPPIPSREDICLQRLAMRHLPVHTFWHILHMLQEAEAKLHWWVIKNSSQCYYYLLHFQLLVAADYTA